MFFRVTNKSDEPVHVDPDRDPVGAGDDIVIGQRLLGAPVVKEGVRTGLLEVRAVSVIDEPWHRKKAMAEMAEEDDPSADLLDVTEFTDLYADPQKQYLRDLGVTDADKLRNADTRKTAYEEYLDGL